MLLIFFDSFELHMLVFKLTIFNDLHSFQNTNLISFQYLVGLLKGVLTNELIEFLTRGDEFFVLCFCGFVDVQNYFDYYKFFIAIILFPDAIIEFV